MLTTRRQFVSGAMPAGGNCFLRGGYAEAPPAPFGALPSRRQLAWSLLETYAFLHFSVNTFTNLEWGNGDEDPNVFQPSELDPDQIIGALKQGGMKAVILTCKHHDGFCLWPTKTTDHSVLHSSWRDGKGDVVRDISDAARRHGLKFGVYVSPWDRNNAHYGKPEYLPIYREQITELLTNYGPIFEIWFDGANGGDGYYGGAREKRSITKDYYQWPLIFETVRRLQPEAVIFGTGGDIRWIGNEKGFAPDTSWATYSQPGQGDSKSDVHASADWRTLLPVGTRMGDHWQPAECDVSIRPGWFYHPAEDDKVRTPDNLVDLYFHSVGHGASLLLNIPPNRRGLISPQDAAAVAEFHRRIERQFQKNLAADATIHASNVRGNQPQFGARSLIDGNPSTYWATDDEIHTPELMIEFKKAVTFDVIRIREEIALGQRIAAVAFDAWQDNRWVQIADATTIGSCRLIRLQQPVTSAKVRFRVTDCPTAIALSELGLY